MSNTAQKLSKSILFQFLNLFINGLLAIIIVPFILDSFGVEKYGVFELILSLMVIDTLLEFGVGSTVVKYTPNYKNKGGTFLNDFFWTFTFIKFLFSLCALVIVIYVAYNFSSIFSEIPEEYHSQIKYSCFIFGFGLIIKNILLVRGLTLKGLLSYDYAISSDIIAKLIYFTILFILLETLNDFGLVELSFMMFVFTPVLTGILYTYWLRRSEPSISFWPKLPDKKILKETFGFMGGMTLISLIAQVFIQGNRAILGIITNPVSVAVYGVANKIRSPMLKISDSILRPLIPATSSIDFDNKRAIAKKITEIARIESILIVGMATIIILITPDFLNIWLSGRLPQAALVIQVWLVPFLLPRAGVMLMFYYGQGRTKASLVINSINTAMSLALALVLVYKMDVLGFILGLSISISITSLIYLVYFCRYYDIKFSTYFFQVVPIPFVSMVATAIFYFYIKQFYMPSNWIGIIIIGALM
ncbi:oligosaccharide flippase family protein, partial [Bacteroidota bacterium]